jgi:hypothetical protein
VWVSLLPSSHAHLRARTTTVLLPSTWWPFCLTKGRRGSSSQVLSPRPAALYGQRRHASISCGGGSRGKFFLLCTCPPYTFDSPPSSPILPNLLSTGRVAGLGRRRAARGSPAELDPTVLEPCRAARQSYCNRGSWWWTSSSGAPTVHAPDLLPPRLATAVPAIFVPSCRRTRDRAVDHR